MRFHFWFFMRDIFTGLSENLLIFTVFKLLSKVFEAIVENHTELMGVKFIQTMQVVL